MVRWARRRLHATTTATKYAMTAFSRRKQLTHLVVCVAIQANPVVVAVLVLLDRSIAPAPARTVSWVRKISLINSSATKFMAALFKFQKSWVKQPWRSTIRTFANAAICKAIPHRGFQMLARDDFLTPIPHIIWLFITNSLVSAVCRSLTSQMQQASLHQQGSSMTQVRSLIGVETALAAGTEKQQTTRRIMYSCRACDVPCELGHESATSFYY